MKTVFFIGLSICLTIVAMALGTTALACPTFTVKVLNKMPNGHYWVSFDRGPIVEFEEDDDAVITMAAAVNKRCVLKALSSSKLNSASEN